MSEASNIDMGELGFSVMKPGSADLFDENGRPSLSAGRGRDSSTAPAPAAESPASEPAPSEGSDSSAIDPEVVLQVEESRLARLRQEKLPVLPPEPTHPGAK